MYIHYRTSYNYWHLFSLFSIRSLRISFDESKVSSLIFWTPIHAKHVLLFTVGAIVFCSISSKIKLWGTMESSHPFLTDSSWDQLKVFEEMFFYSYSGTSISNPKYCSICIWRGFLVLNRSICYLVHLSLYGLQWCQDMLVM